MFRGLAPFVKSKAIANQDEVPHEHRLSETLRIERIDLVDCLIEYDDGTDRPTMVLDDITLSAELDETKREGDRVWHHVVAALSRPPLADLHYDGYIDLDDLLLRIDTLSLEAELDESTIRSLPQSAQSVLREYDVQGSIAIEANGDIPLNDIPTANLSGAVRFEGINFASGQNRLPIALAEFNIALASGVLYLSDLVATVMDGDLTGHASLDLQNPDGAVSISWNSIDWDLSTFVREGHEHEDAPLTGLLSTNGNVRWSPSRKERDLSGRGELLLLGGQLTNLPILSRLRGALMRFDVVTQSWPDNEFAMEVDFEPDRFVVREFTYTSATIGGQGLGNVAYDGSLDLTFRAGPVERIASELGKLGSIVSDITGRIVRYRISGTLEEPVVNVQVFGFGR